jgi:succinate dehydrogenase/fumarate reductase cytochrome b subunit
MQRSLTFLGSSIGRKAVMAATGIVLHGFVVAHMLGNLQIYLGLKAINDYGEFLRYYLHGQGLWIVRAVLVVAVGLHILDGGGADRWRSGPVEPPPRMPGIAKSLALSEEMLLAL